jgi:putative transposase
LCGHRFSSSAICAINQGLDENLTQFARRRLTESHAYLILDTRYEKVRDDGMIQSRAVQQGGSFMLTARAGARLWTDVRL